MLVAAGILGGCTVGPDYRRPEVALTPSFKMGPVAPAADDRWWMRFNDPLLNRLVETALSQNLEIAAAAARLDQARAVASREGAALLPSAGLDGSFDRNRQSLLSPIGTIRERFGQPRDYSLYQLGARAYWEIDLFGGLRRGREAARADFHGAAADAGAVRLSIAAEVVDAYLQLRGLQARLAIAQQQVETESQLFGLVRQRLAQDLVSDREVNRVAGELEGLRAALAPLRAGIAGQLNRIDVLTGYQAGTDPAGLSTAAAIPIAPDPAGSSEPAQLMRRRPDVVAAERRLEAANARIGQALSEYYPKLSLSGLLGFASVGTGNLFTSDGVQAIGSAGLRWRLFDFGRVDADVARARGSEAEALARYRGSVLRATEEVESALAQLVEGRKEAAAREKQVAALAKARDQARNAYAGGAISLIDVLDADRALLSASDALADVQAGNARASVAAIRALGGGWKEDS
ncbi:hypothetical protein A0J57_09080 [Sphingobium sp. 22B]|nr:hypothetical protein AXW74_06570 [Sphingobium sp. AM]KYC32800.1 hypothetical protein A0J57_09080 [Sphingobium sp. 22B]